MAQYQWKGAGYGIPQIGIAATFRKTINLPKLVADGAQAGLALVAAPNVGVALPSTGFAASDVLEVFWVPKGTIIENAGAYCIVAEGASCTISLGVTTASQIEDSGTAGWFGTFSLNTEGATDGTADGDAFGTDNVPGGELFITNGSMDILFNTAATETAVFEIWAKGFWIGDLTDPGLG